MNMNALGATWISICRRFTDHHSALSSPQMQIVGADERQGPCGWGCRCGDYRSRLAVLDYTNRGLCIKRIDAGRIVSGNSEDLRRTAAVRICILLSSGIA